MDTLDCHRIAALSVACGLPRDEDGIGAGRSCARKICVFEPLGNGETEMKTLDRWDCQSVGDWRVVRGQQGRGGPLLEGALPA